MPAAVLVGGGRVLDAVDGGVVAFGTLEVELVLEPKLISRIDLPLTTPAATLNPGFVLAAGAGGGAPLEARPLRENWSRSALLTAALAAAPAAFPAADVARSVSPATPRCVETGVAVLQDEARRFGREAKYSSSSEKNACFSCAGRLAIIVDRGVPSKMAQSQAHVAFRKPFARWPTRDASRCSHQIR